MKRGMVMLSLTLFAFNASAATLRVPAGYSTIQAAAAAARPGDIIALAPGTYHECVELNGVSLMGANARRCAIEGNREETLLTISGKARIANLAIRDGENGIRVAPGASVEVEHCRIIGNKSDGIGFENAFNTFIEIHDCLIAENGDGVDLESTQAVIRGTRFKRNHDDGLDLDGDAGALVYNCEFIDNGDDGIEIRLATRTHAIVQSCRFSGNGEDGLEIIDSPLEDGLYNILGVQNCAFSNNKRFGVGFVDQETETNGSAMSKTAVYATQNDFRGPAVSPNYTSVFEAGRAYSKRARVNLTRGQRTNRQNVRVRIPVLLAVYDLRPTTDGTMASDAEGVAVSAGRLFVADDNNRSVHVLSRKTGEVIRSIPTAPFPDGGEEAHGAEGLALTCDDALLLADDYGRALFELTLDDTALGRVTRRRSTEAIGPVEGIEQLGDHLIAAVNRSRLYTLDSKTLEPLAPPVELRVEAFGEHIAGVGGDVASERVFVTLSAYTGSDQKWRNQSSAFAELKPRLSRVNSLWHLGPFSNDPRGIALDDGLVYVADGRGTFTDERTGEINRGGIKVLVFTLDSRPKNLARVLPHLPIRQDTGTP